MTDEILTERRAGALWIVVDRPAARNAMTFAMYDRIAAICRDANGDDSVKAVVISGAGDAFVAGTDIAQFVDFKEASQALEYERRMDSWLGAIEDVRVPTIAALRGPVVGGGLAIAAACDLTGRANARELLFRREPRPSRRPRGSRSGEGARLHRASHRRAGSTSDRPRDRGR